MERRKAIKNIGLTFGAFVATPTALSLLQSCQTETPWMPTFLTEDEGKVVRKLVDAMLPAVDELPSATEVNVHVFIDKFMGTGLDAAAQAEQKEALGVTIKNLLSSAGKETVSSLKMKDYEAFLDAKLKKTKTEEDAINERIKSGDEAEDLKVYGMLTGLRGIAIWAYKTNERVGETILAYKPVPGTQQGCIPVQEATGGRAWSLT